MPQRVALVTGCSAGGMGAEFCKELRKQGWRVFATARRTSSMAELETLGCDLLELDVTKEESLVNAVDKVKAATGGTLHLLINNAGRGLSGPAVTASMADVRQLFETNVFGLMACTQAFITLLVNTAERDKTLRPRIVNVGSVAGIRSTPFSGLYGSSKYAVHGYSDALRLELKGLGVDVLVLAPGVIITSFAQNVASLMAQEGAKKDELQQELYPNMDKILEIRAKAMYGGARSDAATWAVEQVKVMTRALVPAYYISGGQSFMFRLFGVIPTWLTDRLLYNRLGCWLVGRKGKSA